MAPTTPIRAAQYLRMSTEHQQYSLENQAAAIQEYGQCNGFAVVRSYEDAARTGLMLKNRVGLQRLLADVLGGNPGFNAILVYDVSRWGRFQDTDEAAHYEFICKHAGVPVHYCAEQFGNDGSISSLIMKTLKRTMAAEYSRELGVKVYNGQRRLVQLGFKMGAAPGYGLRRMLVSAKGESKGILAPGVKKSISTDRVILVPGPRREQRVVRSIYAAARAGKKPLAIATELNDAGVPFVGGVQWNYWNVREILRNPKYAGCCAWGRTSQRLDQGTRAIARQQWVRKEGAFEPIVSQREFAAVQALLDKKFTYTQEEMLNALRRLLSKYKKLSMTMISRARSMPCASQYKRRFGSMKRAYELIGYEQNAGDFDGVEQRQKSVGIRRDIADRLQAECPERVELVRQNLRLRPHLLVDSQIRVSILICPAYRTVTDMLRWGMHPHRRERNPVILACALREGNKSIQWLYAVPMPAQRRILKAEEFEQVGIRVPHLWEFPDVVRQVAETVVMSN